MSKLVEMKNIYKSFFGVEVLHDVNFELNSGEVVALCGENGAGKSTLMKILAAVYDSDKGEVFVNGNPMPKNATTLDMAGMGVSMIHQELNLMDHLTVAQNIFLTREIMGKNGLIDHHKMNVEARKLLDMLGQNEIDEKEYVRNLKIAQKQMVEIAKAVSFDVKVLIMDEPTSMLTSRETTILFDLIRRLASEGMGIVYISHRLAEIKEVCDKVTILRDGSLIATKKVSEISEQEIANLMVGREVTYKKAGNFKGDPNDVLLEVQNVSDSFLKDLSFKVRRGEILGFSGLVGAGRSELMEFIFGIRKCQSGKILVEG
ncbi:MAG: sugar ABC transporter ATP-binding protein, partial [Eubacterium sp.]|nr:sugar ABC transporter ATP-binding protein [Eubacterium sp.]